MSVELIAEIASNHGGDVGLALEFVDTFAPYVDTIKFQLTRAQHLRAGDTQQAWFERAELALDDFARLKAACHARGVNFLLTVYNPLDVWELLELGCTRAKVGSGEAGEATLAQALEAAGIAPIVSCGLWEPSKTPFWAARDRARFLGCVTRYPAPAGIAAAALLHYPELAGWSDHAIGTSELEAAAVVGAEILETHVFLQDQARPIRPFEKSVSEMRRLSEFLDDRPERFLGRWQS